MGSMRYTKPVRAADDIKYLAAEERNTRKESDSLPQILEYIDGRAGEKYLVMKDLVYINFRTGEPAKSSAYNTHLYKLCDEAETKRFCLHARRHTYATRAMESGMQPKVLPKLLGYKSIKTTLNRYICVIYDAMASAIAQFEANKISA